ncbi:class I SAM-dependent methyltransferase [Candidatus Woesearchaeota archaeon]|nr:class I SAM-dependent methyltransferase [Candidatus Woesearchaeota archaeon]
MKQSFYDKYPFYYEGEEKKNLVLNEFPLGRFIKKYIKEDSILVDVGCGCGIKAKYILDTIKVKDYTGLDFSENSLKITKKHNPNIKTIHASATKIPLPSNYSNIVISDGVIHHTDSPYTSFKEITRIAKKGAKIYISTYNREHLFYWAYRFSSVLRFLRKIHLDILNKIIFFPLFYLFWMQIGTLRLYKKFKFVPLKQAWLVFNDNLMTPIARYYYNDEILLWCDVNKLKVLEQTTYVYGQMLSYVLEKC